MHSDPVTQLPELERTWMNNCREFEWQSVLVRPFGNVALVHSTIRQLASVADQDWSGVFMLTDARALRGEQWKVVSRHGTGPLPGAVA